MRLFRFVGGCILLQVFPRVWVFWEVYFVLSFRSLFLVGFCLGIWIRRVLPLRRSLSSRALFLLVLHLIIIIWYCYCDIFYYCRILFFRIWVFGIFYRWYYYFRSLFWRIIFVRFRCFFCSFCRNFFLGSLWVFNRLLFSYYYCCCYCIYYDVFLGFEMNFLIFCWEGRSGPWGPIFRLLGLGSRGWKFVQGKFRCSILCIGRFRRELRRIFWIFPGYIVSRILYFRCRFWVWGCCYFLCFFL